MGDEVDDIVEAWQRERPDLDSSPMQVLSRMDRLAGVLAGRRAAVFAGHALRRHEFDVLAALRRSGTPFELTAGELATRTYVTSGTMTSRLDGLTDRGLVTRQSDPVDGRLVRVTLTAEGRRRVDAAVAELLVAERELLAPLAADERAALASSLRALLAAAASSDQAVSGGVGPDEAR
jgi:DNA-binding MarR family transcriptional regulator